jgi:hypothetical protein
MGWGGQDSAAKICPTAIRRYMGRDGTALRRCHLTFERLATALLFLAAGAGACFAPAQSDTWWQLRTGEAIWTTGTVDLTDRLSYIVAGSYWPNHEWLSQVLFYAGYRAGGLPLLTALTATVIVGAWLLIWRLTPGSFPPSICCSHWQSFHRASPGRFARRCSRFS